MDDQSVEMERHSKNVTAAVEAMSGLLEGYEHAEATGGVPDPQLIREADPKIAAAKLPGEAEALVAEYHGVAMYQTEAGVTAAMAAHTSFKRSSENTRALSLLTKWGEVPATPPAQPLDQPSPGIAQGDDPLSDTKKPTAGEDAPRPPAEAPTDKAGTSVTQPGVTPGADAGTGSTAVGDEGLAASGPVTQATPGAAATPRPATPLGGGGVPSMGGLGSGGGGMGSRWRDSEDARRPGQWRHAGGGV